MAIADKISVKVAYASSKGRIIFKWIFVLSWNESSLIQNSRQRRWEKRRKETSFNDEDSITKQLQQLDLVHAVNPEGCYGKFKGPTRCYIKSPNKSR